jgi:RNA polymerase sigma-70 factor (ECF subfamily)
MQEEPTDEQILSLFRTPGEQEKAFRLIVRKYQRRLYYLIRRMTESHDDTDDILQDVFLNAWRNLERFRGESSLYTWLYRIATNETLGFLNKRNRMRAVPLDDTHSARVSTSHQSLPLDGDTIQLRFNQAVDSLPDKQKMVFNLKYFENMQYNEMSDLLGTSEGALKASYHHAVKKIQQFLTGD